MWKQYLLFLFLTLASLSVASKDKKEERKLKCYQCNSYYNTSSCDVLDKSSSIYLQACPGRNDTHCRIMWMEVKGEKRVVRSCGQTRHHRACYQTTSMDTKSHVCECEKDGCNQAPPLRSTLVNLFIVTWISVLLFR
ncbi:uncharacterized protein LOC111630185 [Centruroides sculpturatus]|uniref:uncharacterized protein LOC111630185 n=1 Tax=Centruroides sculpturatus TaxID=218467 RepID=UPI000C6D2AB6|nr:uncharacterized protein LOC111630185 [Centruroides sculpturatus]